MDLPSKSLCKSSLVFMVCVAWRDTSEQLKEEHEGTLDFTEEHLLHSFLKEGEAH